MDFIFTKTGFSLDGSATDFPNSDFYLYCFNSLDKNAPLTEKYIASLAEFFLDNLLSATGVELERENIDVSYEKADLEQLADEVPFSLGSGYVDSKWIKKQLDKLLSEYKKEISSFSGSVDLYFNKKNESLSLPSRLYFHLVQTKGEYPFACMVTYTTKDEEGLVHHYPLRYALTEYKDKLDVFSSLISPLSKLSQCNECIKNLVESGKIFYPIRITENEAYELLENAELFQEYGIECRIPNFWKKRGKYTSVSVSVKNKNRMDTYSILSIKPSLIYEGVSIEESEIKKLLEQKAGLAFLKGKWVVLDKKRLEELLQTASLFADDMSLADLVSYSSGVKKSKTKIVFPNKNWLQDVMNGISKDLSLPESVNATLRPYQVDGFKYLYSMSKLGFGMCLADDMGLGKTVQVLSFLEKMRVDGVYKKVLLTVPSSLIGNWVSEINKFTPSMDYSIYHGTTRELENVFLTITTYGVAAKDSTLLTVSWDEIILDEAQNIKNSATKAYKSLNEMHRNGSVLLTGTPVENNLMNLWALMSYSNKGILGTKTEFSKYAKDISRDNIVRLKSAINPFILRRMKTDKSIISDLPDKIENDVVVELSKSQIVLYNAVVAELEACVESSESDIDLKGQVLASILKLKQICNHPDQYNGETNYKESESGKFELLRELAQTIHENREKVLVFTQFKEIIPYLDKLLSEVFEQQGLTLDGSVSAKKRTELVKQFQEGLVPYMILSLRAAGVGLNLTKATHVIHFDRWWNPAVENQATDRAYRIGQKNKVMVYKFITKDTIEEKIDALIKEKQELADSLLGDMSSDIMSKLSPKEILNAMKFTGGKKCAMDISNQHQRKLN